MGVQNNPHGKVECSMCGELGAPVGGVTVERQTNRIHMSFNLPPGWACIDCELFCTKCGLERPVKLQPLPRLPTARVIERSMLCTLGDGARFTRDPLSPRPERDTKDLYNARRLARKHEAK